MALSDRTIRGRHTSSIGEVYNFLLFSNIFNLFICYFYFIHIFFFESVSILVRCICVWSVKCDRFISWALYIGIDLDLDSGRVLYVISKVLVIRHYQDDHLSILNLPSYYN